MDGRVVSSDMVRGDLREYWELERGRKREREREGERKKEKKLHDGMQYAQRAVLHYAQPSPNAQCCTTPNPVPTRSAALRPTQSQRAVLHYAHCTVLHYAQPSPKAQYLTLPLQSISL
jgi:hypothetical protein